MLTEGTAQLLLHVAKMEQEFDAIVDLVTERNSLHRQMQSDIGKSGLANSSTISPENLEAEVSRHVMSGLKSATDDLYESVDAAIDSSEELIHKIYCMAKTKFRGHKIITYTPLPESG